MGLPPIATFCLTAFNILRSDSFYFNVINSALLVTDFLITLKLLLIKGDFVLSYLSLAGIS